MHARVALLLWLPLLACCLLNKLLLCFSCRHHPEPQTLVDVLDPGHLEELREGESRELKRVPRLVKKAVRRKRRVKDVTNILEHTSILKPEFVKGLVGLLSPDNAVNGTVSGRDSPLPESANVDPAAFTEDEEGPPFGMHSTPKEIPSPPDHPGGKQLVLYQPLPFGMIVQDTEGADGGESRNGGSRNPKGGKELMLYRPSPFGMVVRDMAGADGGESWDGGSARAVVSDAMGTSNWVLEGPPSHIAVVDSDDGAEDEQHPLTKPPHVESVTLETVLDSAQPDDNGLSSAREVSPALVRWGDRRITQPHPAVVGVVSAIIAGAVVLLLRQWRARRTRLRRQALGLARQDALRRVILRDAGRSRQREVSDFWRWRLATATGVVADLRVQHERAAAEHEAARAADREAAQERQEAAVGVVTAMETRRRESAETALDEAREAAAADRAEQEALVHSTEGSLVETQRELRETRQGVTESQGVVEELQQQLKNIENFVHQVKNNRTQPAATPHTHDFALSNQASTSVALNVVVLQKENTRKAQEATQRHLRQRKQVRHLVKEVEGKQKEVAATMRALTEARRDGGSLRTERDGLSASLAAKEGALSATQDGARIQREQAVANARQLEGQVEELHEALTQAQRQGGSLQRQRNGLRAAVSAMEDVAWEDRNLAANTIQRLSTALEASRLEVTAEEEATAEARAEAEELRLQLEEALQALTERQREADSSSVEMASVRTERDGLRVTLFAAEGRAGQSVAKVGQLEGQVEELRAALEAAHLEGTTGEVAIASTRAEAEKLRKELASQKDGSRFQLQPDVFDGSRHRRQPPEREGRDLQLARGAPVGHSTKRDLLRKRLGRHFALGWVIQRVARSHQRQISAFWRWRLAPAPATAPILRQREWEESIGSGAVVAETAPRRRDASAEPATARVEEERQEPPDTATGSDSSATATATAPQAAVTTLAADLRTQPESAASDDAREEKGEAPHCGTRTVADRVQHLERREEEVRSQREDEKARGKAPSGQREGLRTAAQENAKQAPSGRTPEDGAGAGSSDGGGDDGGDGLRASVLKEESSDRFASAPAPAPSPVCRGHSSPRTGETGFAAARGGGGAGCVPDATRQTKGGETPMTGSSAPPMNDIRGSSPQVLEGLSASNMTSATGDSELQGPPSAAASSSNMNDLGDTLPERAGNGSHAGIDGDRTGSRPEAIRTSDLRLPYQGETADAVRDFLPFFRDHFDVTIRNVPSESAVCIGKAPDGVVNVAAECFEHGLRLCRDNDVKAADFLLLRARVRSTRDPDGSQYLLPLEVSAKLRRKLRDLGDRYGVVINGVPSRSEGLGSGGGGGGGGGLPKYVCCPRVDTEDNTQDHRKVVQIWGLRNCVVGAFDRVVASLLDNTEYVVKLGPVGADELKGLRFKGKNVNCFTEGGVTEVRISGRPHLADANISTVLQSMPEVLPDQVQCVDMKCTGAMRAFSRPWAIDEIARASGIDQSQVRVTPQWQNKCMLLQVLKLGGDRGAIQGMSAYLNLKGLNEIRCTFLEGRVKEWRGRRLVVTLTAEIIDKARKCFFSSGSAGEFHFCSFFVASLSEEIGEDLWLDGFQLTARADPDDRDSAQAKLETMQSVVVVVVEKEEEVMVQEEVLMEEVMVTMEEEVMVTMVEEEVVMEGVMVEVVEEIQAVEMAIMVVVEVEVVEVEEDVMVPMMAQEVMMMTMVEEEAMVPMVEAVEVEVVVVVMVVVVEVVVVVATG
ncbi:unnamed protein product [Ectocarpus sp. CCAP 1310/34]|nr:unnamed protein product [Ectocarpus sp. CCAP 1310/34]